MDWHALTEAQRILDEDVLTGPVLVRLITALGSIFEVQTVAAAVAIRRVKQFAKENKNDKFAKER